MMYEEFTKMIGFEIEHSLYYDWIEPKYLDFKGDKREFVEYLREIGTVDGLRRMYAPQIARAKEKEMLYKKADRLWRQIEITEWQINKLTKRIYKKDRWEDRDKRNALWSKKNKLETERDNIYQNIKSDEPKYLRARA